MSIYETPHVELHSVRVSFTGKSCSGVALAVGGLCRCSGGFPSCAVPPLPSVDAPHSRSCSRSCHPELNEGGDNEQRSEFLAFVRGLGYQKPVQVSPTDFLFVSQQR